MADSKYPVPPPPSPPNTYNGYFQVVAWIITIALFFVLAKTKLGYTFLFFFMVGSIIVVLAIGSPTIVSIFQLVNPVQQKKQS